MANYPSTTTSPFTSDIVITNGGKAGIGTTSPGAILDVKGDFRVGNGISNSSAIIVVGAPAGSGTDDSTMIQNAINAMAGGGMVILQKGTYNIQKTIELKKGIQLIGVSPGAWADGPTDSGATILQGIHCGRGASNTGNCTFTKGKIISGNVTKTINQNTLSGDANTKFSTELNVGDLITVPGGSVETKIITNIYSNSSLIVNSNWANTSTQTATTGLIQQLDSSTFNSVAQGDFIKLHADDPAENWNQIKSIDGSYQITLVENYSGNGGSGTIDYYPLVPMINVRGDNCVIKNIRIIGEDTGSCDHRIGILIGSGTGNDSYEFCIIENVFIDGERSSNTTKICIGIVVEKSYHLIQKSYIKGCKTGVLIGNIGLDGWATISTLLQVSSCYNINNGIKFLNGHTISVINCTMHGGSAASEIQDVGLNIFNDSCFVNWFYGCYFELNSTAINMSSGSSSNCFFGCFVYRTSIQKLFQDNFVYPAWTIIEGLREDIDGTSTNFYDQHRNLELIGNQPPELRLTNTSNSDSGWISFYAGGVRKGYIQYLNSNPQIIFDANGAGNGFNFQNGNVGISNTNPASKLSL